MLLLSSHSHVPMPGISFVITLLAWVNQDIGAITLTELNDIAAKRVYYFLVWTLQNICSCS